MDKGVISLVNYFNENGLSTWMSCQGHNDTNMSMFWISFTKDITEQDIISFQNKHRDSVGNFASCGRFAERLYVGKEHVVKEWCYFAATLQAAHSDLNKWINQDICRRGSMAEQRTCQVSLTDKTTESQVKDRIN